MVETTRAEDNAYAAAVERCGLVDRDDRRRWVVEGREPARMLNGIVTNTIPAPLEPVGAGVWRGRAEYGMTLTPKGKMISDHRLLRLGGERDDAFLLDLPSAGAPPMRDHLSRFLPPRFATTRDVTGPTAMLTVVGPESGGRLVEALVGHSPPDLDVLGEDEFLLFSTPPDEGPDDPECLLRVIRSGELGRADDGPRSWDLIGSSGSVARLRERLVEAGCLPLGSSVLETLRVESGRPAFGVDMDGTTIPVEAGVHERGIDHEKGCYTGQEVIVRIRDRGKVNRHLRRLAFAAGAVAEPGEKLVTEDGGREVGTVTSVVESPRFGRTIGLGYVRREIEPPARVLVGGSDGPGAEVRALED